MSINEEDAILIRHYRLDKAYSVTRLLEEFPHKPWTRDQLAEYIRRGMEIQPVERYHSTDMADYHTFEPEMGGKQHLESQITKTYRKNKDELSYSTRHHLNQNYSRHQKSDPFARSIFDPLRDLL